MKLEESNMTAQLPSWQPKSFASKKAGILPLEKLPPPPVPDPTLTWPEVGVPGRTMRREGQVAPYSFQEFHPFPNQQLLLRTSCLVIALSIRHLPYLLLVFPAP